MVLTSHDQLGNTGRKTGFWLEEFAAPTVRDSEAFRHGIGGFRDYILRGRARSDVGYRR